MQFYDTLYCFYTYFQNQQSGAVPKKVPKKRVEINGNASQWRKCFSDVFIVTLTNVSWKYCFLWAIFQLTWTRSFALGSACTGKYLFHEDLIKKMSIAKWSKRLCKFDKNLLTFFKERIHLLFIITTLKWSLIYLYLARTLHVFSEQSMRI